MHFRKVLVLSLLILIVSLFLLFVNYCNKKSAANLASVPNGYIGDQRCQSCHKKEFALWKTSDHFKAMEVASDSTVLGDFNNASYSADGVTSTFFRKGRDFYINTQGPDGLNHDYKILYTFGYYPLQQYLVAFPGGRMQVPRVSWDVKKKKWFHQYAGQNIHSSDWLHWTGAAQTWNTMCAACHSTNLQKKYNIEQDNYQTTWSSINVSCESCHGPGRSHVEFIGSEDYKKGIKIPGSYINSVNTQTAQLSTCAPCHSLKSEIGSDLKASGELLDDYIPTIPDTAHYYADGQVRDENYIYASFLQSKMSRRGVKCSNCHNPHTGKILFSSNQLCLQCHNKTYDSPAHHFHAVNTEGAECKSCHMPGRTYMGNDLRHDHSLRVPRPDLTVKYGVPNACNSCHTNKSPEWAMNSVKKNYGSQRKYHFSDDLVPGSKLDAASEVHLLRLVSDTATPSIIRATALSYLGSVFTESSAMALKRALLDSDALTRYHALRSLSNFPPQQWLPVAGSLLSDPVRAVRIAAADLFTAIPQEQIPESYRAAFNPAREELRNYLHYQADFADGNVMIGDHYLRLNDFQNAEKFYLRALKKDSLLNYARLNLSVAYSASGNNAEALKVLKTAAAGSPDNDRVFFNLGLLLVELKDTAEAIRQFERAVKLKTDNPRLYYNYGLVLFQKGMQGKAEEIFMKGLAINPGDEDLNYALAFLFTRRKQIDKARKYIHFLKNRNPDNPEYQALFRLIE